MRTLDTATNPLAAAVRHYEHEIAAATNGIVPEATIDGANDAEIEQIAAEIGFQLPPQLREFLRLLQPQRMDCMYFLSGAGLLSAKQGAKDVPFVNDVMIVIPELKQAFPIGSADGSFLMVECDADDNGSVWHKPDEGGAFRIADDLLDLFELMTARLKGGGYSWNPDWNAIEFPPDLAESLPPDDPISFWNRTTIRDLPAK